MANGWWLDPQLSLGAELNLEAARRAIPRTHRHDLEAAMDSALVHLLRQALARVQELELQAIVNQPPADRHHQWAARVRQNVGAELLLLRSWLTVGGWIPSSVWVRS